MCMTCGCGNGQTRIEGESEAHEHTHLHADGTLHSHAHRHAPAHDGGPQLAPEHMHEHAHEHVHSDGTRHAHGHSHVGIDAQSPEHHGHAHPHRHPDDHDHAHGHDHAHHHDRARGPAPVRRGAESTLAPALDRTVQIERDILSVNNQHAAANRRLFAERGVLALNLVSSPGAGKTTLLVETIRALAAELPLAVIEGDQQTTFDAERIRGAGCPAIQINTGKGCHLDARQVERALAQLTLLEDAVLFIENVGNLVCPAAFDLGEAHKVVVLSVTEGEDKPLKYPDMFAASSLLLLNKIDLLPHVRFDVQQTIEYARRVRPGIEVLQVSATTGAGMPAWLAWLRRGAEAARERRRDDVARLKRRIAELETQLARAR